MKPITTFILLLAIRCTGTAAQEVWDDTGWTSERPHTVNQVCQILPGRTQYQTPVQRGGYYQQQAAQPQQMIAGPPGPQGEAGPQGPPGPAAEVDIDAVAAKVRESFEPLRMTEIDYDVLAPKLADIIRADVRDGRLPELQGPPGEPAKPPTVPVQSIAADVLAMLDNRDARERTMPFGLTAIEFGLSALGIGSGAALPIWGLFMVARTLRHIKQGANAPDATHEVAVAPTRETIPFPVSIDAPPTPQYHGVDQRFVTVERDSYQQAHAYAKEQLARRFPKSVEYFTAEKSLIDQFLAGSNRP